MKTTIKIFGDMYEVNVIEIQEETIERLIEARDGDNEFWDGIEDIEEEIMGDSLINGFTVVNGANFNVEVDGVDQPEIIQKFDEALKNYAPYCMDWDPANYLVFEKWSTGSVDFSVSGDFDETALELDLEDQILPDQAMRTIVTPSYDGEEFTFVGSKTSKIALYVITEAGEKISL